jgi:phage-related protein
LAYAYEGEMAADYEYYRNAEYKIVVPFNIDGKEFARAEASYMQNELDKKAQRESRKLGKA